MKSNESTDKATSPAPASPDVVRADQSSTKEAHNSAYGSSPPPANCNASFHDSNVVQTPAKETVGGSFDSIASLEPGTDHDVSLDGSGVPSSSPPPADRNASFHDSSVSQTPAKETVGGSLRSQVDSIAPLEPGLTADVTSSKFSSCC